MFDEKGHLVKDSWLTKTELVRPTKMWQINLVGLSSVLVVLGWPFKLFGGMTELFPVFPDSGWWKCSILFPSNEIHAIAVFFYSPSLLIRMRVKYGWLVIDFNNDFRPETFWAEGIFIGEVMLSIRGDYKSLNAPDIFSLLFKCLHPAHISPHHH